MKKKKWSKTAKAADMEFCQQQANPGQVDGEGHGGGSCFPHWEGGNRDCRHGVFRSFGTGCGIPGIAWAGLHDDVPEKGARLDCFPLVSSCRGSTVSCQPGSCGRRKFFPGLFHGRNGGQELRRSIHARVFKSVSAIFFARWSKVPMDLGMPMCSRLLIHAYGTSVLCLTARAMMSLDGWL